MREINRKNEQKSKQIMDYSNTEKKENSKPINITSML